jgi:hypothetical protein
VGQDLKLGIVGANGQASLTVSATWQLSAETEPEAVPEAGAGGPDGGSGSGSGPAA